MKTIILGLWATLTANAAGAQSTAWNSCADTTRSAPYSRCVLSLERGQLTRGWPGELVTIDDPQSPIALGQYVRGEPARRFALRYERETRTALVLRYAGAALVLSESITGRGWREGKASRTETGVVMTGLGLMGASLPFRWLAWRDGERAVAAHNAGLAH